GECCQGGAIRGVSLPLSPGVLACTPDPNNPGKCLFDPVQTGLTDANAEEEADQPGQICGVSTTGTINSNVTVSAHQQCNFASPCQIKGNLKIDGGGVWLGCD